MKRKWILSLLLSLPLLAGAQVGGGLSLGLNAAQFDGDGLNGYKKLGLNLGGFAWYDLDDRFSLQPEILYSERGARENLDLGLYHLRFSYLDVPLQLGYQLTGTRESGLQVLAGPAISCLLWSRIGDRGLTVDATDSFRRFSGEGHLGLNAFLSPHFSLLARASVSFTNINLNPRPWMKHRYVSLCLRWQFIR